MFDSPFVLSLFVMGFIFGLISIIFSIEISGKVVACVCLTLIIIILPIQSFLFSGPLFHIYFHVIKVSKVGERIKVYTMLLKFLLDFLPSNAKLSKDCYEAKKIIKDLGLSYEKIHACPKDCILYWKENANFETCRNYNLSRWESNESKVQQSTNVSSKKRKKKATKILWWFPLKPRLK